jgi:arginase family enzyme
MAVRSALERYSTFQWSTETDLRDSIEITDLGDVDSPDGPEGVERVASLAQSCRTSGLSIFLGGDNSATYAAMSAVAANDLHQWGLITFDAHHDVRDGWSNGSPVRQLLDDGLDGRRTVQVGIGDYSNSPQYAARVKQAGITVVPRSHLRSSEIKDVVVRALDVASSDGRPIYVDVDLDVVDRAYVPACPASAPGGMTPDDLRVAVRAICADSRVRAIDFTEVDVGADSEDGRTVRLVALLLLEACAGYAERAG